MNIERHRRAIEKLYTDRCSIFRHEKVKDPVTKETKLIQQPVCTDQPCRISQRALGQNNQTEVQNEIQYETKMFITPELDIRQGDLLEVTRGRITKSGWEAIAPTRKYTAGEPFLYPTHQEVSLQRKEWA
jgi:hypothetical protein